MMEKAIFAGGCFWCTEAIFQRIKGVESVQPGYTGGTIKNPGYREVCTGRTGHAEAIEITYDRELVSFETLMEIFFATHNPTTLNRQGADVGTPYRSAIFYTSEIQKKQAEDFILKLNKSNFYDAPIVTEITLFNIFLMLKKIIRTITIKILNKAIVIIQSLQKLKKLKLYFQIN